jgi:hypothetical protein
MSPRKQRVSKTGKEANAVHARQASDSLQASLDSAASVAETESMDGERAGDEAINGELASNETVTVKVDSAVEMNGDVETTRTAVRVEMPAHSPKLALPETTADIITKAKEMVAEARRLEGEPSHDAGGKRKATELDDESDPAEDQALQPAKKARLLEQDLRKQKVRNRALFGVAATLALGYVGLPRRCFALLLTSRQKSHPVRFRGVGVRCGRGGCRSSVSRIRGLLAGER